MVKNKNKEKLITQLAEDSRRFIYPPIVVVMGHVDHGKSSLLDFIRKTNLVDKEAGGITQSIGAYEIIYNDKKITFIDTPGHEAFSKMRTRGAKVADLAILVVAADDGVKPQTKEVINILKQTQTPFVVAISKIDKLGVNIEKIKEELTQAEVLLEGYGGDISWQAISSKNGQGIDELLDLILLAAEIIALEGDSHQEQEELTRDHKDKVSGVIIEARIDSQRGNVVTVIIKNGVLKIGEEVFTQSAKGKIKILENFIGKKVEKLAPSSPALILGFEVLPQIGEEFSTCEIKPKQFESALMQKSEVEIIKIESKLPIMKLMINADTSGSLEAISGAIKNLPMDEVKIEIINESVGNITDGDIKLAKSTKSIIIGFRIKVDKIAEILARTQEIKIITSEIIYDLIKGVEREIISLGLPKIIGDLEILAIFSKKEKKQLIGGKVISGIIKNKSKLEVKRDEKIIGQGKILNLQHQKQNVAQVEEGKECGVVFEFGIVIEAGDRLIIRHKA